MFPKQSALRGYCFRNGCDFFKNTINISHTILENINEDYVPSFPQVIALSDNDMRIIKDNYTKAVKAGDRQIISKLSDKIKSILKVEIDPTKMTENSLSMLLLRIITITPVRIINTMNSQFCFGDE